MASFDGVRDCDGSSRQRGDSVEPSHVELLALIDAYIESAVDCKLLIVGKKMYATGAVQAAYASSVSNKTLWTISNSAFDVGLRCRMLDVNWWLSAARRGLLSINLMPVSLPNVSELGARVIALDMLYLALKKCAKDVIRQQGSGDGTGKAAMGRCGGRSKLDLISERQFTAAMDHGLANFLVLPRLLARQGCRLGPTAAGETQS